MKIINNLIFRYLGLNKKRTILAVLGIAFSVFAFVVICSVSIWWYSYMISIEEDTNGSWQARFYGLDEKQAEKLSTLKGVKTCTIYEEENGKYYADVELTHVNGRIFKTTQKMGEEIGVCDISYHMELLNYYGITDKYTRSILVTFAGLLLVIMGIFVIFIYNVFSVSFIEKRKYIGLLACIGASVKQRLWFVLGEGLVIGIAGIPIGLILGSVSTHMILPQIKNFAEHGSGVAVKDIPYLRSEVILVSAVLGLMTAVLSALVPSIRAGQVCPLDMLSGFRTPSSALSKPSAFSMKRRIERNLALKNLTYQKKKSITVIAMAAFAIVVALNGFVYLKIKNGDYMLRDERERVELDSWVQIFSNDFTVEEKVRNGLEDIPGITDTSYTSVLDLNSALYSPEYIEEDLIESEDFRVYGTGGESRKTHFNHVKLDEEKYCFDTKIIGIDMESFRKYADKIGVDSKEPERFQYPVIIDDYMPITKDKSGEHPTYRGALNIENGEDIQLEFGKYAEYEDLGIEIFGGDESECIDLHVLGHTDQCPPMQETPDDYYFIQWEDRCMRIYMPYEAFQRFAKDDRVINSYDTSPILNYVYFNHFPNSDKSEIKRKIEDLMQETGLNPYRDNFQGSENESNSWIIGDTQEIDRIKWTDPEDMPKLLFIGGSIVLIVMFVMSALLNYILTSVILRKREFAVLESVGMRYRQLRRMLIEEITIQISVASVAGISIGIAIMMLSQFPEAKKSAAEIPYIPVGFITGEIITIIVLTCVASVIASRKLKNVNILETLKNENE